MIPQRFTPRPEEDSDTFRPILTVSLLGVTLGIAIGFGLGWVLDELTPDGSAPSRWEHLRFAAGWALVWGVVIGAAAALTAYKAAVLDAALSGRSWSPRPLPPLSYDEHFQPSAVPQNHGIRRLPEDITGAVE